MPRVKLPIRMGYLDIETTPHKGSFWNLFPKYIPIGQLDKPTEMLCWAWKWEGSKEVIFRRHDDGDFIDLLWELLDEADAVVHYNGKAFDIKHINREFALNMFGPPSPFAQVDLLSTVRQNFRLASNKLDFVCRYFGLGNKVKHTGIELWYDCEAGDAAAWKLMEKYNRRDVVLLPKLYKFLRPWIKGHPNMGLHTKAAHPVCSTCSSTDQQSRGTYKTKTATYERFHCNSCGTWNRRRQQQQTTSENVLVRAN